MDEEKKLYPFRFCTLQDEYTWGSEEFKLADLGYRDSLVREGWLAGNSIGEVMDTYIDRVVGENVFDYYGRQFPVCVRKLHVKGNLPLQVHPDDETASQRYDFLGKEKFWYVARAGKDACAAVGFRRDTDASEVYSRCLDGTVKDILNLIPLKEGQYFHIAPGTPHAAFGDADIVEIAESSPLDFCLCGWGAEVSSDEFDPQLSLSDALDFIHYTKWESDPGKGDSLVDVPEFTVTKMLLNDPLRSKSGEYDSFILYTCVSGEASVQIPVLEQTANFIFTEGDSLLVPAECPDFTLVPRQRGTVLLETTVNRVERDSYINPEVPARLPEDNN